MNLSNNMASFIIKDLKRFIYGTFPYAWGSLFSPHSPKLIYYKFLKERGYSHYPYEFAKRYEEMVVDIREDKEKGLFYVMHHGIKKLYYPRNTEKSKIEKNYRALLIEQGMNHSHHYVDSLEEFRGKTFLDVGSAEGLTSLDAIEYVNFLYLFEFETEWIEALKATFEPWKEKVMIVERYVGRRNDDFCLTLDEFIKDKSRENLFLKMDIEGAECEALMGAEKLFTEAKNLDFAICTYHRRGDEAIIGAFLNRHHCKFSPRDGYFYVKHKFRTCLFRGHKA